MSTPLSQLIQDTLKYARDPLTQKKPYFSTQEEHSFFHSVLREQEAPLELSSSRPLRTPPKLQDFKPVDKTPPPVKKPEIVVENLPKELNSAIKKTLQKIAPAMRLHDTILEEAIQNPSVLILLCDTNPLTLQFIKSFAKAIDERLKPVKILSALKLEEEQQWDAFFQQNRFELIIATDQIHTLSHFMQKASQLPLMTLSAISVYNDTTQKGLLWKSVCQRLKK